jgi:methylenetetrahydrofolate dehydrogenase (NADP+)/methenyltetrahydrofolate cyclohydrolase
MSRLTGKPVADGMIPALSGRVRRLASGGVEPCLAVVRVGERADDVAYENSIAARAGSVGVTLRRAALPADADTCGVYEAVRSLGADGGVHGILVFRPLPAGLDESAVLAATPPSKDVDGTTSAQMSALYAMKRLDASPGSGSCSSAVGGDASGNTLPGKVFFPCTAEAVIRMLDHYGIPIGGRRAVVIGRSTVIGKPAAHLLLARDATVTVCHSRTPDLAELTRGADIVVCAAGLAAGGRDRRLGAEFFAPGQAVIDVAVNADGEGIYGDVDTEAAESVAAGVTPVPGGLGAVTSLVLMEHVVRSAESI